jgi:branched-chain amino acid transport system ATP-binding protein/urea transport system ATP-binding protein
MTRGAPTARDTSLSLSGVVAGYGKGTVLGGVDLDLGSGERVGLLGRNGAGKTTLLRALMGLLPVRAGDIRFAGQPIRGMDTFGIARLGIAYVPQGREVFPDFSVEQNLLLGCVALADRAARDLSPAFDAFPWLRVRRAERAGSLSGGQQQQLAIARAIVSRPRLLLLDEPLEGVQPSVVDEIVEALARLGDAGAMGLLLVEQNVDVVLSLCTRVAFVESGAVRETHPSDAVRDNPQWLDHYLGI